MVRDRADYTVGWISALPLEMTAAVGFFDEEHPQIPQLPNDLNAYELGRIGVHNVVVACLPSNTTGVGAAAAVAAQMLTAFPKLRFGLMVGIGGGVSNLEEDIRLGDVVVSEPSNVYPGVIQYDSGKLLQDKKFERTGSLSRPPQALLAALARLKAKHMRDPPNLLLDVQSFTTKYPHLADKAERHGVDHDLLFESDYVHPRKNDPACAGCDRQKLVERQPRQTNEPAIHYGLIASGNLVMRDSSTRDELAEEFGILCFEMEAAGLMNTFPCLVVRGICDYSDSHKNKKWQLYAAVTAAAFTKRLLGVVPAQAVSETQLAAEQVKKHNIPFNRNSTFVGRNAQLDELETQMFTNSENMVSKIALYGLGGIGKTQIVLELAYRLIKKQPNFSIFWVVASSIDTFEQSYLDIAQLLNIEQLITQENDVKQLVKRYLSKSFKQEWLMIVDNADDIAQWFFTGKNKEGVELLSDYLPQCEYGRILFTTRNRETAVKMAPKNFYRVHEMSGGKSKDLLGMLVKDQTLIIDRERVSELLDRLACLPLALSQAAAYMNAKGRTVVEYLSLLSGTESDLIETLSEEFEEDERYKRSADGVGKNPVAMTWLVSFEEILRSDELAAEYLSIFSCMNRNKIPVSVLPKVESSKRFFDAIGTLEAYSFVTRQITEADGDITTSNKDEYYDMHRLVHIATRSWLKKKSLFNHYISRALSQMAGAFPTADHRERQQWAIFLPHAYHILGHVEIQEDSDDRFGLMFKVGSCLLANGRYNSAEPYFAEVAHTKNRVLGEEHPDTLTSMANLASTYRSQGQWKEAETLGVRVVEICKRVLGEEHPDTLTSMANLASTYWNQGRWKEAETLQVQVVEIHKRVLGEEHPDTLTSIANLASTYSKQGRWKEAETLQVQVVKICKRVLGEEHPDTLTSMNNLASTYRSQGRWKEAEALEVQELEICKRVLGEEHPDTLTSMANLASTYWNQGRWKEAETLEVQVMEIRKRVLGEEHPDTLTSMNNLASTYRSQGRWKEAEALEVQVVKICKRVLGEEHPDTLTSMVNLASTYRSQGQWKEAETLGVRVVEICKRVLGEEHPDTLTSMNNLATIYMNQGRWKEAETLQVQVVEIRKRVLGEEHPDTLTSIANLASTYSKQGRWKEAETLQVQVVKICKRVLGEEHPSTLTSIMNLAYTLVSLGQAQEALHLGNSVYSSRLKLLGPEHPDTQNTFEVVSEWEERYGSD